MEPEVIRMYSSSPPPLDSVADDDEEDEFGEFGGFSGVGNSGIGFADFDTVNYPKSREDFNPSKHFMPIHDYSENVNNFTSLTSITDNEIVSEITTSKKGPCRVLETHISNESAPLNIPALDKKGSSGEKADLHLNSESSFSGVDSTELKDRKEDQMVGTCNGEKTHCLANLTNGFASVDSANPQGIEDLDSVGDSKGFKSFSTHSTGLSIDFSPSPGEEFADFSTNSKKHSVHLGDTELKAHKGLHEEPATSIKENSTLSSVGNSINKVLPDLVSKNREESGDLSGSNHSSDFQIVDDDDYVAPYISITSIPEIDVSTSTIVQMVVTEKTSRELTEGSQSVEEEIQTTDEIGGFTQDNSLQIGENPENMINSSNSDDNSSNDSFRNKPLPPADCESNDVCFREQSELGENVNEFNDDFGDFEEVDVPIVEELNEKTDEISALGDLDAKSSELELCEDSETFNEFGDFDSGAKTVILNDFPQSDDFADFSSAGNVDQPSDWKAFDDDQMECTAWAAFEHEKSDHTPLDSDSWQSYRTKVSSSDQAMNPESVDMPAFQDSESTFLSDGSTYESQQSLLSRLEQIIQVCFPPPPVSETEENITSLDDLLTDKMQDTTKSIPPPKHHREVLDLWPELQDIHDAYGLKHQWGGSYSNKKLLCSLGIDTRNILFTGNKKQPVIVPMYAAGLGMLEPTKEPLKPLSAAEKIASIGHSSPVSADDSICPSDQLQESLPPVQFDWSSSGLTNPLDASGGSTLLNLDFFGPVDDSSSNTTTSFPGVDPELYALTTSKVECSNAGNRVTDAFARLMSTAETTSTSARKPRRDENLSEEAVKVIASLPDLSFMHAKVLMFPATLTPSTSAQDKVD
ncbi:aftiphilin isoform 2-T2 [Pelodytes ibericus]